MWHEQRDRHAEGSTSQTRDGRYKSELEAFLLAAAVGYVPVEKGMTFVDWMALVIAGCVAVSIWIVWRNL